MRSIYISDRRTCAFVSVTSCNAISRNLHIFLYARGSKFHRISAEILFHSAAFSIIPFLEQAPYPYWRSSRETNPSTNLLIYPPISRFRIRFLDTRLFFSFRPRPRYRFPTKLPLCFSSSIESFAGRRFTNRWFHCPFHVYSSTTFKRTSRGNELVVGR